MDANWASKKFEKKIFLMCAKFFSKKKRIKDEYALIRWILEWFKGYIYLCVCVYRICYVRLQTNSEFMQASREAQRRPRWRLKLSNSRDENGKTLMP